ncbi:MAG: DUF2544 domain-containing protein [Deltaproteobacteria bacterium]|nr:DUF2544 domain-containing protein [Deltaproteobacteria bacterium]
MCASRLLTISSIGLDRNCCSSLTRWIPNLSSSTACRSFPTPDITWDCCGYFIVEVQKRSAVSTNFAEPLIVNSHTVVTVFVSTVECESPSFLSIRGMSMAVR